MAITADEARELMRGSMERKGIIFKIRLAWICGRLNQKIEHAAEMGEGHYFYETENRNIAKMYFPLMAKFYEAEGYIVIYDEYHKSLGIFWDWDKLSGWKQRDFLQDYDDYHTKGIVIKD